MNTQLTVGQLAKAVGLPTKTIRYYEEIKLVQPAKRLDNNYREYSEQDVARLRLIKQARALDLPLSEVKQLVQECVDGSCEHLKENFLNKLPKYIASVNERTDELQRLKEQLETLQHNLTDLALTNPKQKAIEKDCCEVLKQIEEVTTRGGEINGRQKKS